MDRTSPLNEIALLLTAAFPANIQELVSALSGTRAVADFAAVTRELFPKRIAEHILGQDTSYKKIDAFFRAFQVRYYNLDDVGMWDGVQETVREYGFEFVTRTGLPVPIQGLSYDDWHEMPERALEFKASAAIVYYDDAGIKVALCEDLAEVVGRELVATIPLPGYTPEELEEMLRGTEFEDFTTVAEYLSGSTGNLVLDATYETYGGDSWSKESAQGAKEAIEGAQLIWVSMNRILSRIAAEPKAVLTRLLETLADRFTEEMRKKHKENYGKQTSIFTGHADVPAPGEVLA